MENTNLNLARDLPGTNLVLVRGLPGSGKSTLAKTEYPEYLHFEADMFFIDEEGVYKFDPNMLGAAHDWCYYSTKDCLEIGQNVIVTNTFTQEWEMHRYLLMARVSLRKVNVTVVELTAQYGNIHGVPEDKLAIMAKRWASWDSFKIGNTDGVEYIKR